MRDKLLTDTLDGDDGAIEDGDLGDKRPNDQRVFSVRSEAKRPGRRNGGRRRRRVGGVSLCVAR